MKIFLDDVRNPKDCLSYMHTRIGKLNPIYDEDWVIIRNYEDFTEVIEQAHLLEQDITHISFDHDLADEHYSYGRDTAQAWTEYHSDEGHEKTGLDCAEFVKDFYKQNGLKLPIMFVHSMNPVGTQNIINLFND